jgi:hypothetical protein
VDKFLADVNSRYGGVDASKTREEKRREEINRQGDKQKSMKKEARKQRKL